MKKKNIISIILALLFLVLIITVKTVDVSDIGPEGTEIGFSTLNKAFHDLTGVDMTLYKITDILGYIALLVAAGFALCGLVELIKRKSIMKVDGEILATGGIYVIMFGIYALFEKIIVNYRPIIMEGETLPEASFPSSHTMLILVIMGSAAMVAGRYIKNKALLSSVRIVSSAICFVTVLGRLICGVHWLTDIIGGILISAALLVFFSGVLDRIEENRK